MKPPNPPYTLDSLLAIASDLRSEEGCPWDKEQTHLSVIPNLLEETYEVIEALENQSDLETKEELGDLLFQIVFHSQLAGERGAFSFNEVASGICEKLIRRHPHVYKESAEPLAESTAVLKQWDEIKAKEKSQNGNPKSESVLDGIPNAFPAFLRSQKIQSKARKQGFDWQDTAGIYEKLEEEILELKSANSFENKEEELGDIFFVLVNLAHHLKIDPETALRKANTKFESRFRKMEIFTKAENRSLKENTFEEWDRLWNKAKES